MFPCNARFFSAALNKIVRLSSPEAMLEDSSKRKEKREEVEG